MSLIRISDLVSLNPETVTCNGKIEDSVSFEADFDKSLIKPENLILEIEQGKWKFTDRVLEVNNQQLINIFNGLDKSTATLHLDGFEWTLDESEIILEIDWLAKANIEYVSHEDGPAYRIELPTNRRRDWENEEITFDIEIYSADKESYQIKTITKTSTRIAEKERLYLSFRFNNPKLKYIGSKITYSNYFNGDQNSYSFTHSSEPFILLSHEIVPIDQYWGRGNSDITMHAYRMNDNEPVKVEKPNVRKKILRKLAKPWLDTLKLKITSFGFFPKHPDKTCICAEQIRIELGCDKYDLKGLHENEYLNSEFVDFSGTMYALGGFGHFSLNFKYNDGIIIASTSIDKELRSNIISYIDTKYLLQYRAWNLDYFPHLITFKELDIEEFKEMFYSWRGPEINVLFDVKRTSESDGSRKLLWKLPKKNPFVMGLKD